MYLSAKETHDRLAHTIRSDEMIIQQLAHLFEPWHRLYGDSKVIPALTEAAHILSLLFGGGLAIAADRATLRARRAGAAVRANQLAELHDVHRPVLIALCGSFVTGVALAGADVEVFAASPAFWVKLGLVALLLANGGLLAQDGNEPARDVARGGG